VQTTVPLGRTGLRVSPLCLGGNVFGWSAGEDASFEVLEAYSAAGGNFLDTANSYSAWAPGNRGGESETIIGRWLKGRRERDAVVIATKCGMQPKGLRRDDVLREAEGSLRRLDVDRIDLFYAHEDDADVPLEETLGAFGELVDQGLVTAIGASNYPAARLAEARRISEDRGLPSFEVLQPRYSLIERRGYEGPTQELCREEGIAVTPYTPLARGFLTGKYRLDKPIPDSVRARGVLGYLGDPRALAILAAVDAVAAETGASPAQVSLAWLLAKPEIPSVIASATRVGQLEELLPASDLELSPEQLEALDAAGRTG
jgi:aryl-alcohol dehydrogenase-like predicted oxidoreductase